MSDVIKVHGAVPRCAHPQGCAKHGDDGYCTASCCDPNHRNRGPQAYCSEHSHRPTKVLEILGHPPTQGTFTRAEVESIVRAMWIGAGMVFEAEGHFAMKRDVDAKVRAAMQRVSDLAADLAPVVDAAYAKPQSIRLTKDVTIAGVVHGAGTVFKAATSPGGRVGVEFGHGAVFPLDPDEYEAV